MWLASRLAALPSGKEYLLPNVGGLRDRLALGRREKSLCFSSNIVSSLWKAWFMIWKGLSLFSAMHLNI